MAVVQSEKLDISGLGTGHSLEIDPSMLDKNNIVIMNGDNEPIVMNKDVLNDFLKSHAKGGSSSGPLKRPCACCDVGPAPGQTFSHCAKCSTSHYCSRKCQVAHWPQHKAVCKSRAAAMANSLAKRNAAKTSGQPYYGYEVLRDWYRLRYSILEYAGHHILDSDSPRSSHAAIFNVEIDENDSENPEKVKMVDMGPGPISELGTLLSLGPAQMAMFDKAVRGGYMVFIFMDLKHHVFHNEFYYPKKQRLEKNSELDPIWRVLALLGLNGQSLEESQASQEDSEA